MSANAAPDDGAIGRTRLIVRSEPAGARILVDGRYRGVAPATLVDLHPGDRLVTLTLRGKRVDQSVRLESGSTASVFVSLLTDRLSSGRLAVSAPVELDIIEDGVLLGTTRTPTLMLPAGSHTLRFVNELIGFEHTEEVVITPGELQRIGVQLPTGTLNINARPWAEVSIDGTVVGETPLGDLKLPLGTHTVVLRHPQFGERVVPVVVRWNVPGRVSVDMRR